jgi:hypothetical protein
MKKIGRATFIAGVITVVATSTTARAADAKRTFLCKAHLDSVHDKRTIRQLEVQVTDGKSADVLDGTWSYDRMPRSPRGLAATFSVKDGAKIHLKGDFEYGASGKESAGGNNVLITDSKTAIEDDFAPGVPVAYPWKIAGDDYLLVVSVEPVVPK